MFADALAQLDAGMLITMRSAAVPRRHVRDPRLDIASAQGSANESIGITAVTMDAATPSRSEPVTLGEAFWVWLRIAGLSLGGPAGQIAVMHRVLVEEKRWIGEQRVLHALSYCMLLPGPRHSSLPPTSAG